MDKDKVARLMETPDCEMVEIAPSEWNQIFTDIHPEDMRLLSNSLIRFAEKAIRMATYLDVRSGRNQGNTDHSEGVRAQNEVAEKLRGLLGYQEPKADIEF
jgi:hypothetical protein